MRCAHEMGLKTTATMMFGHVKTVEERILHLLAIRDQQAETAGFNAIIPWPYQPGKNTLSGRAAGGTTYLHVLALSRAVAGRFALPSVVLGLGVIFWTAGFDIRYACQNVSFDRQMGLHSTFARLGTEKALKTAALSHIMAFLLLSVLYGLR